jgi:IS30 family transposase
MRRVIPRKSDLSTISDAHSMPCWPLYNNTTRKCLDWRTPAETFLQVLHFELNPPPRLRGDDENYFSNFPTSSTCGE